MSWIYLISAGIGMPAFKGEEKQQQQKKNNIALKLMNSKVFSPNRLGCSLVMSNSERKLLIDKRFSVQPFSPHNYSGVHDPEP